MRPPPVNTFSFFTDRQSPSTPEHIPYQLWSDSQMTTILDAALKQVMTNSNDSSSTVSPPHRRLNLSPSRFSHGCICGHNVEIRDLVYDLRHRKNTRCPGITIRPKTPPLAIGLRC